MIKGVNTTVLSKDHQPVESLKKFIEKTTGAKLRPVARTDNAFWYRVTKEATTTSKSITK